MEDLNFSIRMKYENKHTHSEKKLDVTVSIGKYKMKLEKRSIPFDIKLKCIYNKIFQEMGFICSECNTKLNHKKKYK
ncbi:hypothetical protein PIROE2DRAFT_17011 [Piromyces sp. E2]|nr:hypothetical protein PIROE2DRAFT_17011 [Piromyces sp. E2]|eukprot:OUM57872.1 hypothetical protein PIROE2DRAFT_17011 [Piromyces sp. E2]